MLDEGNLNSVEVDLIKQITNLNVGNGERVNK